MIRFAHLIFNLFHLTSISIRICRVVKADLLKGVRLPNILPSRQSSLTLADAFLRALPATTKPDQLGCLLSDLANEMGFRYFAMIHHDDLAARKPWHVDIRDYPPAIADRIIGKRLDRRDPIIRGCAFADSAFVWSDLHRIITLDRRDKARLEFGATEGLDNGITVPCWSRGDCLGSCTFAGLKRNINASDHLGAIQLIGIFGFQHARRLARGSDPVRGPRPRLNPRPRDCVMLAGRGLSNKEIARALDLTPRTVDGYLTEARRLFDARDRTELVIAAVFAGEVSLHELQ
jgi:LuxR family quorum-sensing system transcriptional regulator CciR